MSFSSKLVRRDGEGMGDWGKGGTVDSGKCLEMQKKGMKKLTTKIHDYKETKGKEVKRNLECLVHGRKSILKIIESSATEVNCASDVIPPPPTPPSSFPLQVMGSVWP